MAPPLYRIILQVDNLDKAEEFYGKLLGDRGRRIPRASRLGRLAAARPTSLPAARNLRIDEKCAGSCAA